MLCIIHPTRAEVEKIDCARSQLVVEDFTGLTCETVQNAVGEDYGGQFDYYGVYGEQGYLFRNLELAIAGLRSHIDPDLQLPLKEHFENRFFWIAEATAWSKTKQAGRIDYITFEVPYGDCIGFFLYEGPREQGYKYALNGVFCHKGDRTISLRDLQEYLAVISFE